MNTPWPHEANRDVYNEAILGQPEWWIGLKETVEKMFVVAGEEEVLIDEIKVWADRVKGIMGDKIDVYWAKGEAHDMPNLDLTLGYKQVDEGQQAKEIKRWIQSRS